MSDSLMLRLNGKLGMMIANNKLSSMHFYPNSALKRPLNRAWHVVTLLISLCIVSLPFTCSFMIFDIFVLLDVYGNDENAAPYVTYLW